MGEKRTHNTCYNPKNQNLLANKSNSSRKGSQWRMSVCKQATRFSFQTERSITSSNEKSLTPRHNSKRKPKYAFLCTIYQVSISKFVIHIIFVTRNGSKFDHAFTILQPMYLPLIHVHRVGTSLKNSLETKTSGASNCTVLTSCI